MWGIVLRQKDEVSLSRQIFISLKERILSSQILPGEQLPSTRELAKGLGISRNTVSEGYDMLWTEGYILRSQGAPSRVAQNLNITIEKTSSSPLPKAEKTPVIWDFKTGQPDLSFFPWQLWRQILHEVTEKLPVRLLEYSGLKGYEPLCVEISHFLMRSRSMQVAPEDVFITSGATQGLRLLVDILYKKDCAFALEDPSHNAMGTLVFDRGYPVHWMPVDRHGADVSTIKDKRISAVYVTPSHQFPLGGILPATRRAELIRLAANQDFYIIEDDYDSEFRYCGPPVSPIYSMDSSRVIYVGTFSKTLFPALRVGFAILPKALQKRWNHDRNYMDVQNPILEQVVLSEFSNKRKMDGHIKRMSRVYGEKRKILLNAVSEAFGDSVKPWGDASGLHVALEFPEKEFGSEFVNSCKAAGIRVFPVSKYCYQNKNHTDKLLLGYGHLSHKQIEEGIRVIKAIMG